MAVTAIIMAGTTATVIITVGITAVITVGGTSTVTPDVAAVRRRRPAHAAKWSVERSSPKCVRSSRFAGV